MTPTYLGGLPSPTYGTLYALTPRRETLREDAAMFTQLNPPLPLDTPKGSGLAYGLIDYGPDFDLLWVVFDDTTGECWTWPNPKVRSVKNITLGHRTDPLLMRRADLNTNGHTG